MDESTATNNHPSWRDYEALIERLSEVVRSNTNTLRLVHAAEVSNAKAISEAVSLCSELKGSSAVNAERVAGRLDLLIEVARGAHGAAKDAVAESRATNDKLGVTREEISELRHDLTPARGVPLLSKEEATRQSPPEGVSMHNGKVTATFGLASAWTGVKRHGPTLGWLTGAATALWHGVRHFFGH